MKVRIFAEKILGQPNKSCGDSDHDKIRSEEVVGNNQIWDIRFKQTKNRIY